MTFRPAIGLSVAALLVTALPAPAQAAVSTVGTTLQTMSVAPAMTLGFKFTDFGTPRPKAKDSRGCGERERVLIDSAVTKPRVSPGCRLSGGSWRVGGSIVRSPAAIQVVPLVSEKGAWSHGAYGWSNGQQRSFVRWYQQPARECAVSTARFTLGCGYTLKPRASVKLTASQTDLMSLTSLGLSCPESAGIVGILASWGLSIDPDVQARVEAANCDSTRVQVLRKNRTNPVTIASTGNPYLAPANVGRAFEPTEVLDAAPGPVISAEQFGLHVPDVSGPEPTVPFAWLRLWDAKTGWEPLEQNRGTYFWKWIDDSMAFAEARGLKVMYVFGDTPAWAGPSPAYPPTELSEFRRYVNAVVSRYGTRVAAYEVWNEPNVYSPMADEVANLVDMTLVVREAVDRWAPGSKVLTPSTTMRTDTTVYPFFKEYLEPLAEKGWPVDGYTVHTYPTAAEGPAFRAAQVGQFQQMLTLAGAPRLPAWDTEVNYGLGGLRESKRSIDEPDASGYLSQTFLDSIRLGVTQTDWYLWFPEPYFLLGIQTTPQTLETNAAWRWTYDQLVGSRLRACSHTSSATICGFERNGQSFALAWSPRGDASQISVPRGLSQACSINGSCSPISGGKVTLGIRPVKLT